ncbi:MAG: helix-turn-helix domain-containing protein [Candidatus Omnitrophota bacterium]
MRQSQPLTRATILVIDDDPAIKGLLDAAFSEYEFIQVLSGGAGLELLKAPNEIDLIILDYRMGLLNGIQVLEKIREICPDLPVILFTAFGSKQVAVEALEHHADDLIDKPFKIADMRQKIQRCLDARQDHEKALGKEEDPVQRVVHFVKRNFDKSLTLDDAALVASLSPKYLSRLFKQETHQSFTEFRLSLRMEKAKELLESSALHIGEIAGKLGYESEESFVKMFKKIEGCTPTEYRHAHRLNPPA